MTCWVYIHGGPPFGIRYANEVVQEFRKINPDTLIYYYTELEPAIEFKKFKQWINCLEPKKFVFWGHSYGAIHSAYFQKHLPSFDIRTVALDPVYIENPNTPALKSKKGELDGKTVMQRQKKALSTTDVIVYYEPGKLGIEKKDKAYVCHYLNCNHHTLHMFKEVAKLLAKKFGWM